MYDLPREELDKERKLRMWVLDNNCLYMKHVLAENPDIDLWMFTPTWHALNHGYVRPAAVALRTYCPLIRRSQHCQVKNCGLYKLFVALRDGEVCERVWYELSPVHGVLRTSAAVRVIAWARLYLSEVPSASPPRCARVCVPPHQPGEAHVVPRAAGPHARPCKRQARCVLALPDLLLVLNNVAQTR